MGKLEHPFEHLTDAQIEHYGDRTSGEGPNQSSLELDQAIETHLADCAGCRTRVLDFHRYRLGLMSNPAPNTPNPPDPGNSGSQNSGYQNQSVTSDAKSDLTGAFSQAGRAGLKSGAEHSPTPDCPSEAALRDLAAGLATPADAPSLTQHAAQCPHCGPILRAYTEDFSDDLSPEDAALLQQLNSSSRSWQEKVAQKMAGAVSAAAPIAKSSTTDQTTPEVSSQSRVAQPPSPVRKINDRSSPSTRSRLPSLKWILAPAALAATAVMAFFVWNAQRDTPQKVDKLLAQAYTEQRTIEMRWPGAEWSRPQITLGTSESLFSKPRPLFRAEDLIKEHQNESADPKWIHARAQAEILEGHPQTAIDLLSSATHDNAGSVSMQLDLALAHSEQFKRSHNPRNALIAIDLLSRILEKDPENRIALFNLAVAYAGSEMWDQAVSTWEAYLRLEPTGPWAAEAKDKLALAKSKVKSTLQYGPVPSRDINTFLSLADRDIALRSEQYQQVALQNWAAVAVANPASPEHAAISRLAKVSADANSDLWWHDFFRSASVNGPSGVAELMAASVANLKGYYIEAGKQSARATSIFRAHGNLAGELRARYESVYAHRRLLQIKECLARGDPLQAELGLTRYTWLQTQLAMERAVCLNLAGKLTQSEAELSRSYQIAKSSHLTISLLRSIGFAQGLHNREHRFEEALSDGTDGLREYWASQPSTERIYQLYAGYSVTAQGLSLPAAAQAIMRHAVDILRVEQDKIQLGAALEELSKLLAAQNDTAGAETAAAEATQLFESESQEPTARLYRLVARIGLADLQLRRGKPRQALATLEPASILLSDTDGYFVSLDYYRVSGNIHLALHQLDQASSAYQAAILKAERALSNLRGEHGRLEWVGTADDAYRGLIRVFLEQRRPEDAWRLWEWYASRSYPETRVGLGARHSDFSRWPELWSRISSISLPETGPARITYIAFADGLQIWVVNQHRMRTAWVSIKQEDLERLAQQFSEACANRNSPLPEVQRLGRDLFAILVQPVHEDIETNGSASIELDARLSNLPFEALRSPKGWYLTEKIALIYSPGVLLEKRLRPINSLSSKSPFLLADASVGSYLPGREHELSTVSQTFSEVSIVGANTDLPKLLAPLSHSTIFAFIGHAEPNETGSGLRINPNLLLKASDLSPEDLRHMQLAVLPACSTASSGDGLLDTHNLVHAFLSAGVPDVVATRWNVDSEATSVLMSDFYSRLAHNEPAPASLWSARTQFLARHNHPYFWAAFTVTGRAD